MAIWTFTLSQRTFIYEMATLGLEHVPLGTMFVAQLEPKKMGSQDSSWENHQPQHNGGKGKPSSPATKHRSKNDQKRLAGRPQTGPNGDDHEKQQEQQQQRCHDNPQLPMIIRVIQCNSI